MNDMKIKDLNSELLLCPCVYSPDFSDYVITD